MSFYIGPYIGKKAAILAKLDEPNEWFDKDILYRTAKAFLIAQVLQLPDDKPVTVQANGHAGSGSSQTHMTISVNSVVQQIQQAFLVE